MQFFSKLHKTTNRLISGNFQLQIDGHFAYENLDLDFFSNLVHCLT